MRTKPTPAVVDTPKQLAGARWLSEVQLYRIANSVGTTLTIYSNGRTLFNRCRIGHVERGVLEYNNFPTDNFEAMLLNWRGAIRTHTVKSPDVLGGLVLNFIIDAVYVKVTKNGYTVTDIIPDISKNTGVTTRSPKPESQMVLILSGGDARKRGIRIRDKWQATLQR